jgi:translocation and assembly module TamB
VSGSPGAYEGSFRMGTGGSPDRKHEGVRMGGAFRGGAGGMAITISEGSWLRGRLEGRVEMTWPKGLTLRAVLTAKGLDPAGLHRELRGTMEARGEADLSWADGGVPSGTLKVRLRESILQGKRLSGLLEARLMPAGLRVERAFIDGNGFHLSARGVLDERLDYEADVTNAQAVIPSLRGTATGRGWVRLRKGLWAGAVRLNGRSMEMGGAGCARMSLDGAVDEEGKGRLEVKGKAENGHIGPLRFETLGAVVEGTPTDHLARFFLDGPQGSAGTALRGGMAKGAWTGSVETMELAVPKGRPLRLSSKAQIVLSLERIAVSGLTVTGPGGETAGLDGHVTFSDGRGQAGFRWEKIDLARFNAFLAGGRIDGETSGSVSAKLPGRERMDLDVGVTTAGSFTARGQRMEVAGASLKGQWNERGLSGHMGITIKGGGVIRGTVNSPDAGTPGFPLQTGFSLSWEDLDVAGAGQLLPPEVLVEGRLAGRLEGTLVKGGLFDVKGETKVTQGAVGWKERDGVVRARVKGAAVRFLWAQEAFRADGSFDLEERGQLRASCTLPFPARYPFAASRAGPVQASVTADLKELGILPALLRGAVRETRGSLKVDAGLSGTWQEPRLTGQVVLADAAAYLPQAGIRIEDVKARLRLADDRIEVVSLEARSGPGRVKATAFFRMKDWRIEGYEGAIEGDRFEALYLPEARIALSPALSFRGKGRDVAVTGQVTVPEGKILGRQRKDVVRASSDVVIVDKVHDDVAQKAFPVTGKVRVILGDRVAISMDGLEGRLTGDMIVDIRDSKDLSVTGELQIVEGGFSYYGQRLDLDRGRIIFNGPPDNPALDILAIKKIRGFQSLEDRVGEVKAGVAVTGRIRSPFIRLYSQPSMPDVDVLSYILMGRKTTRVQGKDSSDAVMGAAGALAYGSLKSKVSPDLSLVDTVDVQSGGKDMSRSLVTVGKYLNPRLYLGLGGSLFTNTYQIILRYSLTPNLDVESRSGTESGASIYYKIEFD